MITQLVKKQYAGLLLACIATTSSAQNASPLKTAELGAGVNYAVSANGYGASVVPAAIVSFGKNQLAAGPVIQSRRNNISGVNLCYNRFVTGPAVHPQESSEAGLYFFVNASYHYGALLGCRSLWEEYRVNRDATQPCVFEYKFKTAEVYAGAGLQLQITRNLICNLAMGVGGYNAFNVPSEWAMKYNASSLGLYLAGGLNYQLTRARHLDVKEKHCAPAFVYP